MSKVSMIAVHQVHLDPKADPVAPGEEFEVDEKEGERLRKIGAATPVEKKARAKAEAPEKKPGEGDGKPPAGGGKPGEGEGDKK